MHKSHLPLSLLKEGRKIASPFEGGMRGMINYLQKI
jgi:hypothetical protein